MTGHGRYDDSVKVIGDRAGDEFAHRPVVAPVCLAHRVEILRALVLEHDRRRISEPNEEQVEEQSARAAVAIEIGMDPLEVVVHLRQTFGKGDLGGVPVGEIGAQRSET